jgi:hypothetical protein
MDADFLLREGLAELKDGSLTSTSAAAGKAAFGAICSGSNR